MKTRINMDLARARGLRKRDIKKIKALHRVMDDLVASSNFAGEVFPYTKKQTKQLRKTVRMMEYIMQDLWGFEEDEAKHTHWRRFEALALPVTVSESYTRLLGTGAEK
jgi:hypothetical protein